MTTARQLQIDSLRSQKGALVSTILKQMEEDSLHPIRTAADRVIKQAEQLLRGAEIATRTPEGETDFLFLLTKAAHYVGYATALSDFVENSQSNPTDS